MNILYTAPTNSTMNASLLLNANKKIHRESIATEMPPFFIYLARSYFEHPNYISQRKALHPKLSLLCLLLSLNESKAEFTFWPKLYGLQGECFLGYLRPYKLALRNQ